MLINEDFSGNLDNWQQNGNWSIENLDNNKSLFTSTNDVDVLNTIIFKNGFSWKNYVLTTKVRSNSGVDYGIIFRF